MFYKLSRNKYRRVRENTWNSIKYYAIGLYGRFSSEHILINGGSIAFSFLMCLIPWLLLLFSALGFFLSAEDTMQTIDDNIRQFIPLPGYEEELHEQIQIRLSDLVNYRQTAGIIGIIGVFWLSSNLFGTARTILNNIFKINIRKNFIVDKIRDFRVLFVLGFLFIITLFGSTVIYIVTQFVIKLFENSIANFGWLHGFVPVLVGFIFTWAMFYVLYRFLPYIKLSSDVLIIATTIAAVLWEMAKYVFGLYISNFGNITRIYGALTVFAGTALWLYYSSLVFLLGGIIGQLYRERKADLRKAQYVA
jgi:membrane protein